MSASMHCAPRRRDDGPAHRKPMTPQLRALQSNGPPRTAATVDYPCKLIAVTMDPPPRTPS
eukprot:1270610-Amphidinium_carterae.1